MLPAPHSWCHKAVCALNLQPYELSPDFAGFFKAIGTPGLRECELGHVGDPPRYYIRFRVWGLGLCSLCHQLPKP